LTERDRANRQASVAAAKQAEAEKLRDEALASREANSLYRSAYSSWNNDNLTRARENFINAAKQFQGLNDNSSVGASLFALAEIDIKDTYGKPRDEAAAIDSYDEAARYYQQSNDRDGVASVLAAKGAYLIKYPDQPPVRRSPRVPTDHSLRAEQGIKFLDQALAEYEATGNWEAGVSVLDLLRPLFWNNPEERPRTIVYTKRLLALFTKAKDFDSQKKVMLDLSALYQRDGNDGRANEYREAAVKVYRDLGDQRKEAETLVEIAFNDQSVNATEREAYLERALQVFERVRDPEGEIDMLKEIGKQYFARGDDFGAADQRLKLSGKYLEKAIAIYGALGRRTEQAELLTYMGSHARSVASSSRLKEHDELALEYYLRALAIYRALNDKANEKETLAFVAAGYSLVKRLPEAIETNKQLLAFETEPAKQVDRLREIAFMQRELKSPEAIDTFRRMLAIYQATNQKLMQATTLVSIGTTQVLMAQPAEAADSFKQALVLHAGATDKYGRSGALYGLGTAQEALGKLPEALETFKQALALFRETNDNRRAAEAEKRIEAITKLLQPK
jgi:tetratricopeptide (TPR) repeat protein